MPPEGVLEDSTSLKGEVVKDPVTKQDMTVVDLNRPVKDSAPSTPSDLDAPRSGEASPAPTMSSMARAAEPEIWEDWPQVRSEPTAPLYQAVLVRNTRTGEFKERLVGPGAEDCPLQAVGFTLPKDASSLPSAEAAAEAPTTPTNTTPLLDNV